MENRDEVKRLQDYDKFVQIIITEIYHKIDQTPKDGKVRGYNGIFHHNNNSYEIECDFKLKSDFFQILRLDIKFGETTVYTTDQPKMGKPIYKEILLN